LEPHSIGSWIQIRVKPALTERKNENKREIIHHKKLKPDPDPHIMNAVQKTDKKDLEGRR
jgi:hypothetical protein